MTDPLDRLFANRDHEIVPSSGFTHAVMDVVRAAHAEPPPIPFPWTRALLLVAGAVATIVVWAIVLVRDGLSSTVDASWLAIPPSLAAATRAAATPASIWTLVGLLLSTALIVAALRAGDWRHRY